jgi:ribosomal protein L11 methyltransferase
VWRDAESDRGLARVFCPSSAEADQALARIREESVAWGELLSGGILECRRSVLRHEDWAEVWKRHFLPVRVSRRLVVKPTWERWTGAPGDVVLELDPGMCFGTGQHGTTQSCLAFIDEFSQTAEHGAFLDVGCGSGILSLAAWQLGYRPVYALDSDPLAAETSRSNLTRAGAQDVHITCCELAEYSPDRRFRLVVANLLAAVLIPQARQLAGLLDAAQHPSLLVLSGILSSQYESVKAAYAEAGLREAARKEAGDWTSGCFQLDPDWVRTCRGDGANPALTGSARNSGPWRSPGPLPSTGRPASCPPAGCRLPDRRSRRRG